MPSKVLIDYNRLPLINKNSFSSKISLLIIDNKNIHLIKSLIVHK